MSDSVLFISCSHSFCGVILFSYPIVCCRYILYGIFLYFCDVCFKQEADSDPTGEGAQNTFQLLTYYELDLGLNHVVRKYSEPLEEHGNFLIAGEINLIQIFL